MVGRMTADLLSLFMKDTVCKRYTFMKFTQ